MQVYFNLTEMTVADLETLLSLIDPREQARAFESIDKAIRKKKAEDLEDPELD